MVPNESLPVAGAHRGGVSSSLAESSCRWVPGSILCRSWIRGHVGCLVGAARRYAGRHRPGVVSISAVLGVNRSFPRLCDDLHASGLAERISRGVGGFPTGEDVVGNPGTERLSLYGMQVTDAGIEKLRKALPNCQIGYNTPHEIFPTRLAAGDGVHESCWIR